MPVTRSGDHVFYTGKVTPEGAAQFHKHAHDAAADAARAGTAVNFHFTSGGGDLPSGVAMASTIHALRDRVATHCWCEGFVGSSATFPAFACTRRTAFATTLFLLHPPTRTSSHALPPTEMHVATRNIELWQRTMRDAYLAACRPRCDGRQIATAFATNQYADAHAILGLGLIDDVVPAPERVTAATRKS